MFSKRRRCLLEYHEAIIYCKDLLICMALQQLSVELDTLRPLIRLSINKTYSQNAGAHGQSRILSTTLCSVSLARRRMLIMTRNTTLLHLCYESPRCCLYSASSKGGIRHSRERRIVSLKVALSESTLSPRAVPRHVLERL